MTYDPIAHGAKCDQCPLRGCALVPPNIPANAPVIFVGEAPGANEAATGKPFVGQSGKLLDRVLERTGINPASVGRTNAVLCRPAGNATPTASALAACSGRLARELGAYPSAALVTLGASATGALDALAGIVDKAGIMARRGTRYALGDRSYLATLHPAFILRSPGYINAFASDIAKLIPGKAAFDPDQISYVVVDVNNAAQCAGYLERIPANALVAFDVETDGLQWYPTRERPADDLLCFVISYRPQQALVIPAEFAEPSPNLADDENPLMRRAVQDVFNRCRIVAHNGKFDQHVAQRFGFRFTLFADTMLAHYTLDENKGSHGLKELARDRLGAPDYESQLIDPHFKGVPAEKRRYSMIPKDALYEYAAIDACATLVLHSSLTPDLADEGLTDWPFRNVVMPTANAIQQVESNGIRVDVPYLQQARERLTHEINAALVDIQALTHGLFTRRVQDVGALVMPRNAAWIKTPAQFSRVLSKCFHDFNPASWQQVQIILYDVLRLQHTKKLGYKTDPRSTNAEALISLLPNDHSGFIDQLVRYRRLQKILGTYIEKLLALADPNDRVHINYLLHGTEIGRLSATDALHGIPRPSDYYGRLVRAAFVARPGYKLIVGDYSQAELRAFAAASGEPTMIATFNDDRDPHDETAKMIAPALQGFFGWDYVDPAIPDGIKKEIRTVAKNVNFGEIYGGGASGIAAMLGGKIPVGVLDRVLAAKRRAQPIAEAWKQAQFRLARSRGYVQTVFGRKRRFPLITDDNLDEIRKACVHAPIASTASDLTLLSIVALVNAGVMVCGTWHDSIIAEAPIETAEHTAHLMREIMELTGAQYVPAVPWKADVEIRDRWVDPPTD